jgi:PPP family 3-phenylpropionic acid transporter
VSSSSLPFSTYYFALCLVNGIVFPYLPVVLDHLGFSKVRIGGLLGLAPLVAVFAPPVWGAVSDRLHNRKQVLFVATAGAGVCFLGLAPGPGLGLASALVLLYYVCREAVVPLSDGITLSHIRRVGGDYGRIRAWGSIGFVVGATLMAAVGAGQPGHDARIFVAYAGFCAAQLAACLLLPRGAGAKATQARHFDWRALGHPAVIAFAFAAFVSRGAMTGYYSFFSLFLKERLHVEGVGYLWALGTAAEIPVVFFAGWMIRRIGVRGLFLLGLGAVAVRLGTYAWTTSLSVVVATQALHCLTFGAIHVASVTFVDRVFPEPFKATGQTMFVALTAGLGCLLGSAVAGWLVEAYSFETMYGWMSAAATVGLVVAWVFVRDPPFDAASSQPGPR